jgi:SH3-like domain-containing protein
MSWARRYCRVGLQRAIAPAGVLIAALVAIPAAALEFRSVASNAAIAYDAPSAKANKVFILGKGYPVELLVTLPGWYKVRDAAGELVWIEAKDLSPTRTLMVKVARADVRAAPEDDAPVVFQVEQDVLLDFLDLSGAFAHVRHSDGATGYIRISQVWGL